jgi:type II secretory pathway pseudopilin PulG
MTACHARSRRGITLVELVLVLGLCALLLGILLPGLQQANGAGRDAQCQNNLRQLAIAMHNVHTVYNELPPLAGNFPRQSKSQGTFLFYALPYLEQADLYNGTAEPERGGRFVVWKNNVWSKPLKLFRCPEDPSAPSNGVYKQWLATTSYAGSWPLFGKGGASLARIPDGTSQTLMFAERYQVCNDNPCGWGYPELYYWAPMLGYYSEAKFQLKPSDEQCDPALPQGFHGKGIHVALADASVRTLSGAISPETWWHACTPNGGEVLGADW